MSRRDGFLIRAAASYGEMSRWAAEVLISELRDRPDLLFCAAAGATPLGMYRCLAEERSRSPDLFDALRVVELDEWGGLARDAVGTCGRFLREHLLEPLGISERFLGFESATDDPEGECHRVSAWLERYGPIDFCVLGLGLNGHIGLNEPGSALVPLAHIAQLSPESLRHPMLAGVTPQPSFGMTLGMSEILRSGKIVLLVSGGHKRPALERLCQPAISTFFPASLLRLHGNAVCLCDHDAAGLNPSSAFGLST